MNNRRQKILQILEEKNSVSLQYLVEVLDVSQATIRRDLSLLEEKNLIFRRHGGASKKTAARGLEPSFDSKIDEFLQDKKEVAKYVCEHFIENGQTIYLDAGTSSYYMIDYLKNRNITVVTNSIYHLRKLVEYKIHTIILGGNVKHSTQAIVGSSAFNQLSKYSFDACFIGCNGVDTEFGLSTADEQEAILKTKALKNSKNKYVLADISKFGHRKFQKFADIDAATIISYKVSKEFSLMHNIIEIDKEDN